jgi:glutamate-ammonia-ligase adenylyltransferase
VLAGNAELADNVENARRAVLEAKSTGPTILSDTAEMRERIFAAKSAAAEWEAKIGPGRLQDIELMAQTCALRTADPSHRVEAQLRAGLRHGFIGKPEEAVLQQAYRFFWRLQAGGRLLTDGILDMEKIGEGGRAFMLRETGASDLADLKSQAEAHSATTAAIIAARLADDGDAPG